MISITVHHHHHNNPMATRVAPQQVKQAASMSSSCHNRSSSSSNVEVQYQMASYFRPQLPAQRETLKKLQNLSAAEFSQAEIDMNNNHQVETKSIEAKPLKTDCESFTQNQKNETTATTTTSTKRPPMKLHSRSISLIINPHFISSTDENNNNCNENCVPLCRRRSMPRVKRRTRFQLQHDEPSALQSETGSAKQQAGGEENDEVESMQIDGNLWTPKKEQEESLKLRCSMSVPEILETQTTTTTMQTTITTTTNNATLNSESKFRETGILLREISDEFARCRRRTI